MNASHTRKRLPNTGEPLPGTQVNAFAPTLRAGAELYLQMLTAGAPEGALLDVRYRTNGGGVARVFIDARAPDAASIVTRIGSERDVWVGCAMRVRRGGTRNDLAPTALLWVDCDTRRSVEALKTFKPRPTMIVASGSEGHAHAYWALTNPLGIEQLEHANRRLADALGADQRCTDAARILRPPDTLNFKHTPPGGVELIEYTGARYRAEVLLAGVPRSRRTRSADRPRRLSEARRSDPLQQIKPVHYIRLLIGQTPGRDGKIRCPFHDDGTPSLHVYKTPERGWVCYGCTTPDGKPLGGDIYTFASRLWHIPTRGPGFQDLRERLDDVFQIARKRKPGRTVRELADEAHPGVDLGR